MFSQEPEAGVKRQSLWTTDGRFSWVGKGVVMTTDAKAFPLELTTALRLLKSGPADVDWLARRLRRSLQDARITTDAVIEMVTTCTLLVGRPDGMVCRLLDVLEGHVLTQRMPSRTAGRRDLWTELSLLPLHTWALFEPWQLARGGEVKAGAFGHDVLIGDTDWLPEVPAGGLISLRVVGGELHVEAVEEGVVATPEQERAVRVAVSRHIREEHWWSEVMGESNRRAELTRALAYALLENPELLTAPTTPLIELLHDVLSQQSGRDLLDDSAAWGAGEVVSFGIGGMPESLFSELSRRADKYGVSLDRYVVLALGHLAWRTPFAEDLGPWEKWDLPDSGSGVVPLQSVAQMGRT